MDYKVEDIKWSDFNKYYKIRAEDPQICKKEYDNLPKRIDEKLTMAKKLKDIFMTSEPPYDGHIVWINHIPFFQNASLIYDYNLQNTFIITKAPEPKITGNFYDIFFEYECTRFIMLSKYTPSRHDKPFDYFANDEGKNYHDGENVSLELFEETHFDGFVKRIFNYLYGSNYDVPDKTGQMVHFECTCWTGDLPDSTTQFLKFYQMASDRAKGISLLHCPDGISRCGMYIAFDLLIKEAKNRDFINIEEIVEYLRHQRMNMVSTLDQYIFLHKLLLQAINFDSVNLPDFMLSAKHKNRTQTWLNRQFKILQLLGSYKDSDADSIGKDPQNQIYNRNQSFIPLNDLTPEVKYPLTVISYINASYIFKNYHLTKIIATQLPMESTRLVFHHMLYQHKIKQVISLQSFPLSEKYFPDENEIWEFDGLKVKYKGPNSKNKGDTVYQVYYEGERENKILNVNFLSVDWPDSDAYPSIKTVLEVVKRAYLMFKNKVTVLQCMYGQERCALMACLILIYEQLDLHGELDIFTAVQNVRRSLRDSFKDFNDYKFLFDMSIEMKKFRAENTKK